MNALIEFILLAGGSFFLFMFMSYKDAIRSSPAKGPLASILNKFKGWKYEDEKGTRGILYRQPLWIKILISLVSALLIRGVYDLFFDFKWAGETFDLFTGPMAWLLLSGIIFCAITLSYLWPKVKNKVVDMKDNALKKGENVLKESEDSLEQLRKKEALKEPVKEVKQNAKPIEKELPKEPKKKNDPDDIIKDYLG